MKKRRLSRVIPVLFSAILLTGCGTEDNAPAPPGSSNRGTELAYITATVGRHSNPGSSLQATFDEDPTAADASTRAAAGHIMSVDINEENALYTYSEPKWAPSGSTGVYFPKESQNAGVNILLSPTASLAQDGSAIALLHADVLEYKNEKVAPDNELSVTLTHAKALFEITFTGLKPTGHVRTGTEITSYNIPGGKKYHSVINPGITGFTIFVSHDSNVYEYEVRESDIATNGRFEANMVYRNEIAFNPTSDTPLVFSPVSVEAWSEGGSGDASQIDDRSLYTFYTLQGLENSSVTIRYTDGSSLQAEISSTGQVAIANHTPLRTIKSISTQKTADILIGRLEGGTVSMLFDGEGILRFRTDEAGNRLINTLGEMMMLSADNPGWSASHKYLQQSDIYFMNEEWSPPGNESGHFFASYDGAGFSIHDIIIDRKDENYTGLFGIIAEGTIKNVRLGSGSITGGNFTGGIAGYNNSGTIEGCISNASVSGTKEVGGICGKNSGTISHCEVYAGVRSESSEVGGITGNTSGIVTECTFSGIAEGNSSVGGICGINYGTISSASVGARANVKGTGSEPRFIAGICGINNGTLSSCYNHSDVSGDAHIGGICGTNGLSAKIETSHNEGQITGTISVGGITGSSSASEIYVCSNRGDITGNTDVGGIAGNDSASSATTAGAGHIAACFNAGNIVATDGKAGGICGTSVGGEITGCYNTGNILAADSAGGIAGIQSSLSAATDNPASKIAACYNTGRVTATDNAGNITGVCGTDSPETSAFIQECYMTDSTIAATGAASQSAVITSYVFGNPSENPNNWPSTSMAGWNSTGPATGNYWSSLGGWGIGVGGTHIYPKLYWEN